MTHDDNGTTQPKGQAPIPGDGATAELCKWSTDLQASSIPPAVLERAKYLILDGIACGLVGSHVPWSEDLVSALDSYEPEGSCTIIGHEQQFGPIAACTLNSAFIQGTELDDYHSSAPLHSASVFIPALLAAAEAEKYGKKRSKGLASDGAKSVSGLDFLISAIVGFESAPRIGLALNGAGILTVGWHSGSVFGAPAAAPATSKLLKMNADDTESAVGIACTQAGGLMSAQFEGMIKRVQHGFAARNGLFGTLLARTGYVGIKKVMERQYGGFLTMFSKGSGLTPEYQIEEVTKELGTKWQLEDIRVKLHAAVGGTHGQIETLERLARNHPDRLAPHDAVKLSKVKSISVGLSESMLAHVGWAPTTRPLTTTGSQMCSAYVGASQLFDGQVLLSQFATSNLNCDVIWNLVDKTTTYHDAEFDQPHMYCGARVKIVFDDGVELEDSVPMPKGYEPPVSNEEIQEKFEALVKTVVDDEKAIEEIEKMVLELEKVEDITRLGEMLGSLNVKNALA